MSIPRPRQIRRFLRPAMDDLAPSVRQQIRLAIADHLTRQPSDGPRIVDGTGKPIGSRELQLQLFVIGVKARAKVRDELERQAAILERRIRTMRFFP